MTDTAGLALPPSWHELRESERTEIFDRLGSGTFEDWERQAAAANFCSCPVRMQGQYWRDGRLAFDTRDLPDEVLLKACGNRRASVCPSCSRVYARDTWELLVAGITGGRKGVPLSIAGHPMVFATFTAPSFGRVHGVRDRRRSCTLRGNGRCPHGRRLSCHRVHDAKDPMVGEPLCVDCYDYESQVLFNWWAPELWRRFRVYLPRAIAKRLGVRKEDYEAVAREAYAKVAEFQARGVVHFHAMIRVDGRERDQLPGLPVTVEVLTDAIRDAVADVWHDVATSDPDKGLRLRFGSEVDIQPIEQGTDGMTAEKAAGYIAKYATKSTEDFGLHRPVTVDGARCLGASEHVQRLAAACEQLAHVPKYGRIRRWTHQFGWHGHFSTKSRRYSVTLGSIRNERREFQRQRWVAVHQLDDEVDEQGDEVEPDEHGEWTFAGVGYTTTGDAVLAASAAARARERSELGREMRQELGL